MVVIVPKHDEPEARPLPLNGTGRGPRSTETTPLNALLFFSSLGGPSALLSQLSPAVPAGLSAEQRDAARGTRALRVPQPPRLRAAAPGGCIKPLPNPSFPGEGFHLLCSPKIGTPRVPQQPKNTPFFHTPKTTPNPRHICYYPLLSNPLKSFVWGVFCTEQTRCRSFNERCKLSRQPPSLIHPLPNARV